MTGTATTIPMIRQPMDRPAVGFRMRRAVRPNRGASIYYAGSCRLRDITDGASNTYLVGEKYLNPDGYENSGDYGTDDTWDEGFD